MVAQLVPNPLQPNSSQPTFAQGELQKLREYCRRLNQALEVERAKSSKLRQYIARLNSTRVQHPDLTSPPPPQHTDTSLQSLVEDQTRLLEQLYSENQKQYAENQKQRLALTDLENKMQQLLVANDKLKARNIELRRKLRPMHEAETQTIYPAPVVHPVARAKSVSTTKLAAVTKSVAGVSQQPKTIAAEAESCDKQSRWFRFSLSKK